MWAAPITAKQHGENCQKARKLSRTFGFRSAGGFLRNRGYTLAEALAILFPGKR